MPKQKRKFIYLNNLNFFGTVFRTQVLDWLNLYSQDGIKFDLLQTFNIKDLKNPRSIRQQLTTIKESTDYYKGFLFFLPSKGQYAFINAIILYIKLFKHLFQGKELLIFSRALIGKEITYIRKLTKCKIIFYYDLRAASAEEKKYVSIKTQNFTRGKFLTIANIYYLEYQTALAADKIFCVSNVLMNYYINTLGTDRNKFVNYPCLSDSGKFYFDPNIRLITRSELGFPENALVIIYSGGISSEWHIADRMFAFINELYKNDKRALFLFLTMDKTGVNNALIKYPDLKQRIISFSVPNHEVYKYLNAADYGILFRENTIMNNVASPTKFAEYMLCGLPVIISEGVGDYSQYTVENKVGYLLKEIDLINPELYDFHDLLRKEFDRDYIAVKGRQHFAKQSIIRELIGQFKS